MIVDASVLIAILLLEPESRRLDVALAESGECLMSAATLLEASMIMLARKGPEGARALDLVVALFKIKIVPFTESQARLARMAFERYGKDRHPAQLNFGDCMAYALAKETGEPLLFKRTDFGLTDITPAPY